MICEFSIGDLGVAVDALAFAAGVELDGVVPFLAAFYGTGIYQIGESETMETYLDHAAVTVADIEWTMKLFEGVLGMHETRRKEKDGKLMMAWLDGGIQLVAAQGNSAAGRGHHLGLVVDDLPAALAALKSVPGVHGIAGKPEKWVQLPDGLTLEMFQANDGAIDAALTNKLK